MPYALFWIYHSYSLLHVIKVSVKIFLSPLIVDKKIFTIEILLEALESCALYNVCFRLACI